MTLYRRAKRTVKLIATRNAITHGANATNCCRERMAQATPTVSFTWDLYTSLYPYRGNGPSRDSGGR